MIIITIIIMGLWYLAKHAFTDNGNKEIMQAEQYNNLSKH